MALSLAAAALIAGIGGSVLGAGSSLLEGAINRDFTAKENEKNRKWQEHMANTAHQREVADLQAAGLNPYLSASGSGATSSPSGASGGATGVSQAGAILGAAIPNLVQSAKTLSDMNTSKSKVAANQMVDLVSSALTSAKKDMRKYNRNYEFSF